MFFDDARCYVIDNIRFRRFAAGAQERADNRDDHRASFVEDGVAMHLETSINLDVTILTGLRFYRPEWIEELIWIKTFR